jgi:murein DD-endopeptidase MepM/ murein hydrolase activator NlpD
VALIRDTDNGRLDGDRIYDRAVGPFQFIPSTWALFERSVGETRNPHYVPDAVQAVVWHLCPTGTLTDLAAAIFRYNRSQTYVDKVLDWAERYTGDVSGVPITDYALPLRGVTAELASRPHHDYPAWDMAVPVGTPVFAMAEGTVVLADGSQPIYRPGLSRCGNIVAIEGVDQVRYTYCHLASVDVANGDSVLSGQQIGTTGGQPGHPGAGNTTGPHLHLGMKGQGRRLCPQGLLLSILGGNPVNPLTLPTTGCY